jgi:AmmeMemoRadiSam system protein B
MDESFVPRLRPLELVPSGEPPQEFYVLRDPRGLAGAAALPEVANKLVRLMDGRRSLAEICRAYHELTGRSVKLDDLRRLVGQLDEGYFLQNDRFAEYLREMKGQYDSLSTRPAAHAGGAYPAEPDTLRAQLAALFEDESGPGVLPWEGMGKHRPPATTALRGIVSPHVDLARGGAAYAWSYDRLLDETDAELFVVLGTAHTPLQSFYSVSHKDFETPLGTVPTDHDFVAQLEQLYRQRATGEAVDAAFTDSLPHRQEHSIELQTVWLQYVLGGRRDYRIVPILVGSFFPFIERRQQPDLDPSIAGFVEALRIAIGSSPGACLIASVDLAHIGPQFGDEQPVSPQRLSQLWTEDQQLLASVCAGDAVSWFDQVLQRRDENRICGLAPVYTLLEVLEPAQGELLKYDQAVADDASSCVSFASLALY